jgi:CBS domain-containing protein
MRVEWWLEALAEGEQLSPDFLAWLQAQKGTASAIMSAPVITVSEGTEVGDIARLLIAHRIKRVPVVRDDRVIGIVAVEDLLRTLLPSKQDR